MTISDSTGQRPGSRGLFLLCCFLLVLPLWCVEFLPMIDISQHSAQVSILHRLDDPEFGYGGVFKLNLFTPYLLGYGIVWLLSLVVSVPTAVRILVSLAILAVPVVVRSLNKEVGGRDEWAFLAFPIALSFAYSWGMLNFLIGIPIALAFLVLSIRYSARPSLARGCVLALLAFLLFWCHLVIAAVSCLIGATIVALRSSTLRQAAERVLPFATPVPLVLLWSLKTEAAEVQVTAKSIMGWGIGRIPLLLVNILGSPAERVDILRDLPYVAAGAALLALPFLSGAVISRTLWRWTPLAIGLLLYFLVPQFIFGTAFLYHRQSVFIVPLLLIALRPSERALSNSALIRRLPVVFAIGWSLSTLFAYTSFHRETRDFRTVLDQTEPHKDVMMLIFDRDSEYVGGPIYLHFPVWYQVEKGGNVQFSFAMFYPEIVRYHDNVYPQIPIGLEWLPEKFHWDVFGGGSFDYFFVRADVDLTESMFLGRPVRVRAQAGDWWVYERIRDDRASP